MRSHRPFPLKDIIANRRWWRGTEPFPHVIAHNVFTDVVYRDLELAFQKYLSPGENRFDRNMPGYDASGFVFTPQLTGPFSLFTSREWHDMIEALMNINATGDIVGSLHHHAVGSASGRIHNDLNPGWFANSHSADRINVADNGLCNYQSGEIYKEGIQTHETVRAVAILFYVNNPSWSPGDGGETGLYYNDSDPVDRPALAVPPINNSLLCFECTPYSHHSFIRNKRTQRNSVTMWLHRSKAEVVARWGEAKIVYW